MNKRERLPRKIVDQRLREAWKQTIEECFGVSPAEAERFVKGVLSGKIKPGNAEDGDVAAQIINLSIAKTLSDVINYQIKKTKIRTEDELAEALQKFARVREEMPSATRKAMKTLTNMLPRRGGPGRHPKLSHKEASQACDHIAMFIRQKHNVKEALLLMAASSPTLLGKKVGARTLQKAWDSRDKLTGG